MHSTLRFARELFDSYDTAKFPHISSSRFKHSQLLQWLKQLDGKRFFMMSTLGSSAEGRTINLITWGNGPTTVLLWSQMHGDEPTATMALLDILHYIGENQSKKEVQQVGDSLTLLIIPMLNPDGAERYTRRTSQLIDMNRDALALATPEARILKETIDRFKPVFAFNLHDQEPRLSVGQTKEVTAIGLLAPSFDYEKNNNEVRKRAKQVASLFAETMNFFIPKNIARWDDTFESRAFGDNIQKWGTSTVLVESGGWPNDPHKMFIRKLNFVGILSSLFGISTGAYESVSTQVYEQLPFNGKNAYDLVIRGVHLKNSRPDKTDVAINFDEKTDPSIGLENIPGKFVDVGDLRSIGSLEEIDGSSLEIELSQIVLDQAIPRGKLLSLLTRR